MGLLDGLFGGRRLPPAARAALESYLAAADPLWRQLESEYRQWLERMGVARTTDLLAANDPRGEHSGVFVWRTIETERTLTQLRPPPQAARLHDLWVRCVRARHEAASRLYDALQVADVRSPRAALLEAARVLTEAEKLQQQAEQARAAVARLLA
jgi:hypothetical protein